MSADGERRIDQTPLGQHIAAQMDAIEAEYDKRGKSAVIGQIITIVEIVDEDGFPEMRLRPNDGRPWAVIGALRWALGHWESPSVDES